MTSAKHSGNIVIRRATAHDVLGIWTLMDEYARKQILLPRTTEEITKHINSFYVAMNANGKVIGCVCLRDFGSNLFEVRSLVVHEAWHNMRVGSQLVQRLMEKVDHITGAKLFALTYRAHFFVNLGFKPATKECFPPKIWTDCLICAKREHCDEEAVLYRSAKTLD